MKHRHRITTLFYKRWAQFLAGGVALQINLTGCDPEVRSAVLTGIQSSLTGLLTSIIEAFFLALNAGAAGTGTQQPTVQAIFENTAKLFA